MIDLKLDFCFKYIFTNQCDSDSTYLLKLLVEQTTHFSLKRFIITNPEILKLDANDKTIRYDILIQDQQGNQIDIEMQRSHFSKTQAKRLASMGLLSFTKV
ncbi:MAG: PD-(D/E)XK nuclease family transposase [Coprobacillus cateniformis]|uniref:PD-(D/E)XK nuclease family transposase n=1 Tax=Longibaculum muris TaxID=1796628 RepID=UPI003AB5002D|nr:PD-(D/E)XK nuclease family transposase [Coprobacillus cateniformis]